SSRRRTRSMSTRKTRRKPVLARPGMAREPSDQNTPGAAAPSITGTVISVDAMGGGLGAAAVVAGVGRAAAAHPGVRFILHGTESDLNRLVKRRGLTGRAEVRHAPDVVTMDVKPSHAMRHGK